MKGTIYIFSVPDEHGNLLGFAVDNALDILHAIQDMKSHTQVAYRLGATSTMMHQVYALRYKDGFVVRDIGRVESFEDGAERVHEELHGGPSLEKSKERLDELLPFEPEPEDPIDIPKEESEGFTVVDDPDNPFLQEVAAVEDPVSEDDILKKAEELLDSIKPPATKKE